MPLACLTHRRAIKLEERALKKAIWGAMLNKATVMLVNTAPVFECGNFSGL
jgi:hypothetical protein